MTDVNAFCVPSSGITFVSGEWVNQIGAHTDGGQG